MAEKTFDVTIYRVNESAHQASAVSLKALSVDVARDGDLVLETETGAHRYGATTWGKVTIVRAPGR